MLSDQLIPIDQIVRLSGADKIHLAYLTKLRLLPQTIRRKIGNKITGCYPQFVVSQIKRIEDLKNKGLTYSQIRFELENKSLKTVNPILETSSIPNIPSYNSQNPLVYLVVGLVLGYVLFSLNNINNALVTKGSQTEIPQNVSLIAVPNKNLYKLGTMDLNSLVK